MGYECRDDDVGWKKIEAIDIDGMHLVIEIRLHSEFLPENIENRHVLHLLAHSRILPYIGTP